MTIQVIATYEDREQEIFGLQTDGKSEASILFEALSCAGSSGRTSLRKLSLCQLLKENEPHLKWLEETGGKYYFGTN